MNAQILRHYEAFLTDIGAILAGYYRTAIEDTLTLWVEKPQKIIYSIRVEDLVLEKFLEQMEEDLPPRLEKSFEKLSGQIQEVTADSEGPVDLREFQLFLSRRMGRDVTIRVKREVSRYEFFSMLDNAPMEADYLRAYRGNQLRRLEPVLKKHLEKDQRALLRWFPAHFTRQRFLRHLSKALAPARNF